MAKLKTTVGVTAGIFNEEGKLLLRRRVEHDSITGIDYSGCWELPVVAVQETEAESISYNYLCQELVRGVKEEVGIEVSVDLMPAFYPVMFKGPQGYDLAMITLVQKKDWKSVLPLRGEKILVSVQELNDLAKEYIPAKKDKDGCIVEPGRGLLSGFGKRQHCMALKAFEFASPSHLNRKLAKSTLKEIQKGWK